MAEAARVVHVGLVDGAVDEAQRDAPLGLVREQAPLVGEDDAGALGLALVGHEDALEGELRRGHLLDVHHDLPEGGAEGPFLEAAGRARLEDLEELLLEGADGPGIHEEGQREDETGDQDGSHDERAEQAERAHAGRPERGHLEIPRQPPAHQEDGHQQRDRQRQRQERRQHEDQEREHEMKRHVLRDDEVGELVDPVDEEEEREHPHADGEGRTQFLPHVAVEDAHRPTPIVRWLAWMGRAPAPATGAAPRLTPAPRAPPPPGPASSS